MHRPTRAHWLSIGAIVSLLMFGLLAGAGVRSLRVWDSWDTPRLSIGLYRGCTCYSQSINLGNSGSFKHSSGRIPQNARVALEFQSFSSAKPRQFGIHVPLWFPLLLLLIVPVRWLIARSENVRAFPVVVTPATPAPVDNGS